MYVKWRRSQIVFVDQSVFTFACGWSRVMALLPKPPHARAHAESSKDDCIHAYNLPPALQTPEFAEDPFRPEESLTLDEQLAAVEKRILASALKRHNGNRSAAGRELGVSPRMMNYRLNKAGLN